MQDHDPYQPPQHHSHEGSDAACSVLVALTKRPDGMTLEQLHALLGLEHATLRQALIGLSERRRIKCVTTRGQPHWFTAPHATKMVQA